MQEKQYCNRDIDEKLDQKADKETIKMLIIYGISSIIAIFGLIGGLYILYYSGLSSLQINVALLNQKVVLLSDEVKDIKTILSSAEITK